MAVTKPDQTVGLATFGDLGNWRPKIGDFIIWTGWCFRWYGVISAVDGDQLYIVKDGLPKLLFTIPESERSKYTIKKSAGSIKSSRGGEWSILQGSVWYIDV